MSITIAVPGEVYDGFTLYDVTDPSSPSEIGTLQEFLSFNDASGVCRVGEDALVVISEINGRIALADISTPASPSSVDTSTGHPTNGKFAIAHPDGVHAIIVFSGGEVSTFEVDLVGGNLTQADELTGLNAPRQAAISSSGDYLYVVSSGGDAVYVVDISDPTSLSLSGTHSVSGTADFPQGCVRIGTTLFITDVNSDALVALDVSTEDTPDVGSPLGTVALGAQNPRRCAASIDGNYVYVWCKHQFDTDPELVVVDVSDPSAMSVEGSVTLGAVGFNDYVWELAVGTDGMLYVPGGDRDELDIIDAVTDPTNPSVLNTIADGTKLNGCFTVTTWGDLPGPDTPSIESITEGIFTGIVVGSTYSHSSTPYSDHFATEVEVDVSGGDFSSPVATFAGGDVEGGTVEGLSGGTDYIARIRYRSVAGVWSDWSSSVAFTTNPAVQPDTPSITHIGDDHDSVTLESSVYSHPDDALFGEIRFEVDVSAGDFSSPVAVYTSVTAPPWQVTIPGLDSDTGYKARVRHTSIEGVDSDWSSEVAFTTDPAPGVDRPNKPTISVTPGTITAFEACFESSPYESPVASPHVESEWAILASPSRPGSYMWRETSSSELESWCAGDSGFRRLQDDYNHGAVVRHRDAEGRWSSWSDPVSFNTLIDLLPPTLLTPGYAFGAECDTIVNITWLERDAYPSGTTYDLEFSDDFGATWTRLATGLATPAYDWDTTGLEARFGYAFRFRAVTPSDGNSDWSVWNVWMLCNTGILKEPPFDSEEWLGNELWDTQRPRWFVAENDFIRCADPGGALTFPTDTEFLPQAFHDWAILYNEDFGQPIDCDVATHFWQEIELEAETYHWRLLQQRNQKIGCGIFGTGERVLYNTDPPRDPEDPAGSYFNTYTGLTGIVCYIRVDDPWPYGELPPIGYVGDTYIPDWTNSNGGCGSPSLGRRLGWGTLYMGLLVFDGSADPIWEEEVEIGSAPVQSTCTGTPGYGIRMAVRTVNIREDGSRDLRIRVGADGPHPGFDGLWKINSVVENVPLTCGYAGVCATRRASPSFGKARSFWDRMLVVPYDYANCTEGTITETASSPAECPEGGEAITNPPLYFGTYEDPSESAGIYESGKLLLYSRWNKDVDADIPCKLTTREVAPRTTRGDVLFRNVYLVVSGQSSAFVIVTPIVDGELKTDCARSFVVDWDPENPTPPFLRRYELALYEPVYDAESTEVGRRGLRGTHFKLRIEVLRTWECGQLYLDGIELEWDEATERHNKVVEVEEPWVKAPPPDVGHVLFGSYLEDDSAGVPQSGRLLEYGGNPQTESEFVQTDDGADIERRIRSREVAPYGVRGDAIFTAFYLAFLRYNTEAVTVQVIPIVDNTEHDPVEVILPAAAKPILDVREVPLAQDVLASDGSTVIGRRALRGTWIRLELDIDSLPAGVVYMESRGLEVAPATEDQEALVNA